MQSPEGQQPITMEQLMQMVSMAQAAQQRAEEAAAAANERVIRMQQDIAAMTSTQAAASQGLYNPSELLKSGKLETWDDSKEEKFFEWYTRAKSHYSMMGPSMGENLTLAEQKTGSVLMSDLTPSQKVQSNDDDGEE